MALYGQAASEEIRQQLLAKDDLRAALAGNGVFMPIGSVENIINAIERLIDAKIAERRTY